MRKFIIAVTIFVLGVANTTAQTVIVTSKPTIQYTTQYSHTYEITQDKDGLWWWHLQDIKNTILAKSPTGYKTKNEAITSAATARKWSNAPIMIPAETPSTNIADIEKLIKNLSQQDKDALLLLLQKK